PEGKKKYDVVIVGHARKERMETVNRLSLKYRIGTYGNGWKDSLGVVNGIEHVKAINSGKMYLSFAATMAGYENVKVGIF
ncbi:spore maturation protein, partial [Klebsiella oxytoca]